MVAGAVDGTAGSQGRSLRGLLIATYVLLAVLAASAVPIPLYSGFKASIGLTDADIANTMLAYLSGVVATLFFAGTISDAVGRRPLAAIALLFSVAGCFLFLNAQGSFTVLAARAVQGVSCGFAMSAVSALIVDSATGQRRSFGMAMAGCGSLLGVTIGSLAVGFLSFATSDHALIFYIMIVLLALGLVLLLVVPETVVCRVSLRTACKPTLSIDPKIRKVFPLGACVFVAAWGVGTYFQSFSSPVAVQCFGREDPFVASVILALSMAPSVLGAPIEARLGRDVSLRVSMTALLVSTCAMCAFMASGALGSFLVFLALFGISSGMCISGTLRMLFAEADASSTAKVVSAINLVGYLGSAVLNAAMGILIGYTALPGVLLFLAVCAAGATVAVFLATRTRRHAT